MRHVATGAHPAMQSKGRPAKAMAEKTIKAAANATKPTKLVSARKKRPAAKALVEAAVIERADKPDRERIAMRAYELWESQGRPHGQDVTHWHQAEQQILELLQVSMSPEAVKAEQAVPRSNR